MLGFVFMSETALLLQDAILLCPRTTIFTHQGLSKGDQMSGGQCDEKPFHGLISD